jgi:hypothetical protein
MAIILMDFLFMFIGEMLYLYLVLFYDFIMSSSCPVLI